ncbi:hypothetical protein BLAT2472_60167 [Burkholderia latens]
MLGENPYMPFRLAEGRNRMCSNFAPKT